MTTRKERLRELIALAQPARSPSENDTLTALRELLAVLDAAPAVESAEEFVSAFDSEFMEPVVHGGMTLSACDALREGIESRDRALLRQIAELREQRDKAQGFRAGHLDRAREDCSQLGLPASFPYPKIQEAA